MSWMLHPDKWYIIQRTNAGSPKRNAFKAFIQLLEDSV